MYRLISFQPEWHIRSNNHHLRRILIDISQKPYKSILETFFESMILAGSVYVLSNVAENERSMSFFYAFLSASLYLLISESKYHSYESHLSLNNHNQYTQVRHFIHHDRVLFQYDLNLDRYFIMALKPISAGSFLRNQFSLIHSHPHDNSSLISTFGILEVEPISFHQIQLNSMSFYFYHDLIYKVSMSENCNAFSKNLNSNFIGSDDYQAKFMMVPDRFLRLNFGIYFINDVLPGCRINLKPLSTV